MKKKNEPNSTDNPLYHNTWTLLKKYRDVVWSLELSVQQVRNTFEIEYGNTVEEFLDSIYLAGADLTGSAIERHARCIEQSHKMLKLLDSAIDLLRTKHKNGESFYRRRREAIDALSSVLWGYTAKDSMAILEQFFPNQPHGKKLAQD